MFNPKRRLSHSVNYKTCCYANLADVTKNFVCWSDILTHDHLSIIKVSNSFTFVSPNKSFSSCLLSNTGSFFIAVLMYERWKVKKELCPYIAWPILIHTVVSSTNYCLLSNGGSFLTTNLKYKQWKVKKNYGRTLHKRYYYCCFLNELFCYGYFQTEAQFSLLLHESHICLQF